MKHIRLAKKGFTLIELIISITIFSFFMAIGVASYINLSVALKRENAERKLYMEMESVLDDINQWGKFYGLDYAWYTDNSETLSTENGNNILALLSKDKISRIIIKKISDKDTLEIYKEQLDEHNTYMPAPGFSTDTFEPLTSDALHITIAHFFLFPIIPNDYFQQHITTVFDGYFKSAFTGTQNTFHIQSTFSSRLYDSSYNTP